MSPKNIRITITPRQLSVLKLLARFQASSCCSPTIAELAERLKTSRTTVFEHLGELQKKGLLRSSKGKARSLKLTPKGISLLETDRTMTGNPARTSAEGDFTVPLAGRIAAGLPVEAIERQEYLSAGSLFGTGADIFALEVAGDSMVDEGIQSGDYVICRMAAEAHNGQVVVALLDNENATLKKFYKEPARARLEPANPDYQPIYSDNCRIQAVVVGLVRKI